MEDVSVYSLAKAARENPEKSANLGEPQRRDKGQHCVFIDNASCVVFVVVDAEDEPGQAGKKLYCSRRHCSARKRGQAMAEERAAPQQDTRHQTRWWCP